MTQVARAGRLPILKTLYTVQLPRAYHSDFRFGFFPFFFFFLLFWQWVRRSLSTTGVVFLSFSFPSFPFFRFFLFLFSFSFWFLSLPLAPSPSFSLLGHLSECTFTGTSFTRVDRFVWPLSAALG